MATQCNTLEKLGVNMRVLLTGHNGYIGTVMSAELQKAGHDVVGLDTNFFEDCTLGSVPYTISALRKDIRDVEIEDLKGYDAIIHLAALSNDPLGDLKKDWTYDINLDATLQLAQRSRDAGVKRFLYASSCSMYGAGQGDDLLTEDTPLAPITPYAESKVRAEEGLAKLADSGFSPIFLRNATAYGFSPRLRGDIVLNNLTAWAYTTGKIRIMSDGTPWRPIVHVEDISQAFILSLTAPQEKIHNQAFNVGDNSENYQVRELAEIVKETVPNATVEYAGKGGFDPRNYRVDFSKITRILPEFSPQWNARSGARQLYQEYKEHGLTLSDFEGRKYIRLNQLKYLLDQELLDEHLYWKTNQV
jgi:nucleoside-diphosphate-sugar epimerase